MPGPRKVSSGPYTDDKKINVCVSEMAKCHAENCLLKEQLEKSKKIAKKYEFLLIATAGRYNELTIDVKKLRQRIKKLQTECDLQRQYHTIERDALLKELYNVKTLKRNKDSGVNSEQAEQLGSDWEEDLDADAEEAGSGCELSSSHNESNTGNEAEDEDEDGDEG